MLQCCLGTECFGVLTPPRPIMLINLQMDQNRGQLPFHYPCLAFTSDRCLVEECPAPFCALSLARDLETGVPAKISNSR